MNRKLRRLIEQNRSTADDLERQRSDIHNIRKTMARSTMTPSKTFATFVSPDSSTVAAASYNEATEVLTVEFKTGKSYEYRGFPKALWVEFYRADSKGAFFSAKVRPFFKGELAA